MPNSCCWWLSGRVDCTTTAYLKKQYPFWKPKVKTENSNLCENTRACLDLQIKILARLLLL